LESLFVLKDGLGLVLVKSRQPAWW